MTRKTKSTIFLAAFIFLTFSICLCKSSNTKRIILDVDLGIDDFHALVMLLNAEHKGLVKIEAIVTSNGNTDIQHGATNILRLLETIQRTDIPVYYGAYHNILPKADPHHWYGIDGFGDLQYNRSVETTPRKELGIVAVKNLLTRNPKQISLVCLGPLTNIGMLFRIYKDISKEVKEIFIMGGNYRGTEVDYNFMNDPEAASIVLSTTHSPIKMLSLQACRNITMDLQWRFNISIDNPVFKLIDRAERALHQNEYERDPTQTYFTCDDFLALMFIRPEVVTNSSVNAASVDLCNNKGFVVIDDSNEKKNTDIINTVDSELYKVEFIQKFIDICNNYQCLNLF